MKDETRTKYLLANYGNPLERLDEKGNWIKANWVESDIAGIYRHPHWFRVRLKDPSKISEEDAIMVAIMFNQHSLHATDYRDQWKVERIHNGNIKVTLSNDWQEKEVMISLGGFVWSNDNNIPTNYKHDGNWLGYLRSRGYALPWTVAVEKPSRYDFIPSYPRTEDGQYIGDDKWVQKYQKALSQWMGSKTYSIEELITEGVLVI